MPKPLVTGKLPAAAIAIWRRAEEVEASDGQLEAAELRARAKGCEAVVCLLTDRIDAAFLEAAGPPLKIVANVAVGFDNIDVPAARARGVVVTNTPDVLTNATAELTWALILAITRRVAAGGRLVRRGGWSGWSLAFLTAQVAGKQLSIVGGGRIVRRRQRGFVRAVIANTARQRRTARFHLSGELRRHRLLRALRGTRHRSTALAHEHGIIVNTARAVVNGEFHVGFATPDYRRRARRLRGKSPACRWKTSCSPLIGSATRARRRGAMASRRAHVVAKPGGRYAIPVWRPLRSHRITEVLARLAAVPAWTTWRWRSATTAARIPFACSSRDAAAQTRDNCTASDGCFASRTPRPGLRGADQRLIYPGCGTA